MPADSRESAPRISVVIPTYAKGETLEKVLRRLEAQTLPRDDFEVVVVDDGSPDDTPERMARMTAAASESSISESSRCSSVAYS